MSMCYGSEGELWVARADARVEKYAIDLTGFADSAVAPPDEESTETCSPEVWVSEHCEARQPCARGAGHRGPEGGSSSNAVCLPSRDANRGTLSHEA